jgi:hypothetical protein
MDVTPTIPTSTQGNLNPATPKPSGLPIGGGFSFGAPLPIELDLPGMPKRYYEFGPIRFKFILDGKYEFFSVSAKSDRVNVTNELKVDMAKQKASFRTGLKGKLTPNIDAQAIGKLSPDSISHLGLALKDPKKFALGLLRYLDLVIGHNFNVGSNYLSFVGVGFALDPDFCFFSILLPLKYPLKWEHDNMQVSGKLDAGMIIKIGPSAALWKELGKKVGFHNLWAYVRLMIMKANVQLPKVAAQGVAAATEEVSASAFLEMLGTWIGAFSLAIPISFALRDFCLYITQAARVAGVHDGQMMVYADAYVRTIYGMEALSSFDETVTGVKREASQKAADDMNQFGRVGMQLYLEKSFNSGRRVADFNGDNPDQVQVKAMGERMWLKLR